MLSIILNLNPKEADALAAVLAAAAMDGDLSEPTRDTAAKALREIERGRVAASIARRRSR